MPAPTFINKNQNNLRTLEILMHPPVDAPHLNAVSVTRASKHKKESQTTGHLEVKKK